MQSHFQRGTPLAAIKSLKRASEKNRLNPVWKKISGGCNLNRPIPKLISGSGFELGHLEQGYISAMKVSGFNYLGSARKG